MDPGYSPQNRARLEANGTLLGLDLHIFETDVFQVADWAEKNPCYLCARMRRGHLYKRARELGYVETMFGRRRYLPELKSSNFNLRAFGERVARNMPIQGAAADIIKIAMIRVSARLEREGLRAKMILQVHDELIVESPEEEAEQVKRILEEEMEGAVNLSVPMLAEAGAGRTWYEAKG